MENQNLQTQISEEQKLSMNQEANSHLLNTAKWAKFLSIVGFVAMGLLVILGFSLGGIISLFIDEVLPFPMFIFGFIYLFVAAIYFYPLFALLKFSNYAKKAIIESDSEKLTESFRNLKGVFTFIGILTLIGVIGFVLQISVLKAFLPVIKELF